MSLDPLWRPYHHDNITFSFLYAFSEHFLLPISHDEVVYGKGSLINKMPGDYNDKFAGVRVFLSYMMAHPGKKLTFMGAELGQFDEWNSTEELQWGLLQYERHQQLNSFIKDLNKFYLDNKCMSQVDFSWEGFNWIHHDDYQQSIIAFRRIDRDGNSVIVVCNFQPVRREGYSIGVPDFGVYTELINTDAPQYGGYDCTHNPEKIHASVEPMHGLEQSIKIDVPPMGAVFLKCIDKRENPRVKAEQEAAERARIAAEKEAEEKARLAAEKKAAAAAKRKATLAKKKAEKEAAAKAAEAKTEEKAEAKVEEKPAKKAPAKKTAEKKAPAKKTTAKKATKADK
jgi:1,4-alpha-glucan branching enzyme